MQTLNPKKPVRLDTIEKAVGKTGRPISQSPDISAFVSLIQKGIEAWMLAGELLVDMMKTDDQLFVKIRKQHPEISIDMLHVFERIGRKEIYTPLLMESSRAAKRLLELPYETQEKYTKGQIEVVVSAKNGDIRTTKKHLSDLTGPEISQVFGWDEIYDVQAQVKRIKAKESSTERTYRTVPPIEFKKRAEFGTFRIVVLDSGEVVIAPCPKNEREYSIRLMPIKGGQEGFVSLYRMTP